MSILRQAVHEVGRVHDLGAAGGGGDEGQFLGVVVFLFVFVQLFSP